MADRPQIVHTMTAKITDVERWIAETEARLTNARQDLAHLQATLQRFRRNEVDVNPVYRGLTRIFKRGETTALGLEALRTAPDGLDTRELATAIMRAKGPDVDECVFRVPLPVRNATIVLAPAHLAGVGLEVRAGNLVMDADLGATNA